MKKIHSASRNENDTVFFPPFPSLSRCAAGRVGFRRLPRLGDGLLEQV
jgi:hypothetical protein